MSKDKMTISGTDGKSRVFDKDGKTLISVDGVAVKQQPAPASEKSKKEVKTDVE